MSFGNVIALLGGLGAFLFGMKYMGDGLEAAAGPKLNVLMEKLTRNPILGFLVGLAVTAVIQSSSATTVMVMGFLNASVIDLAQATGIIIGANIGTTITSVLIALDISFIAPFCIFVGALLWLYAKSQRKKYIGQIVLGFGVLFWGLSTMSGSMEALRTLPAFQKFISSSTNPFVGVIIGIILCAILQSSSASVGVIQALAMQKLMPIGFAAFVICGINIGSAVPPFLSAISARNNAKRAAVIYFAYNVFGAILFIPFTLLTPFTSWIEDWFAAPMAQVSAYHIIFKVVTALVLLPFTNAIVKLSYAVVPKQAHEETHRLMYIDRNLAGTPSVAQRQLDKEVERMALLVRDNFILATKAFVNGTLADSKQIEEQEDVVNYLKRAITDYMMEAFAHEMDKTASGHIGQMFHVVADLERMGDHAYNLLQRTEQMLEKSLVCSEGAKEELTVISDNCLVLMDQAIDMFLRGKYPLLKDPQPLDIEDKIDVLAKQAQDNHVQRLVRGECTTQTGVIYTKALHDFERVGDHSFNIAWSARKNKDERQTKRG